MLKKLSIQWFRGFKEKQEVFFAIPDSRLPGSGLSIIVGPNNTGKTTLMEALTFHNFDGNSHRFLPSERYGRHPKIQITNTNDRSETITSVDNGSLAEFVNQVRLSDLKIEFIASRRTWQAAHSGTLDHGSFTNSSSKKLRESGDPGTAQRLATLKRDSTQNTKMTNMMKRLIPHFSTWTVDSREPAGDYIKYTTGANKSHAVDLLGDGIMSLFRICLHLISDDNNTLVIDEPELSLHPSAQKSLNQLLVEQSKDRQIIVVTHSPYFVDWASIKNGAKVLRLNKHNDEKCTIHTLDSYSKYSRFISNSLGRWQKPELFDVVAKEVLFSDKILFTEGKEDVGLLRNWFRSSGFVLNFEIFGYGVDGETNMSLFLKMAQDLGLTKVAALFDKNALKYNSCKTNYPTFKILKIETDDIRDKNDSSGNLIREGTFTEQGDLKAAYKANFEGMISEIINFFA